MMTMKLTGTDRQADRRTDGQTNLGIGRHAPPKMLFLHLAVFLKFDQYILKNNWKMSLKIVHTCSKILV